MATATIKTPPSPPASSRRWLIIGIGCLLALTAGIWATTALFGDDAPRLNDNAVVLTKFIDSRSFEQLPFEQQRQYYKILDDRDAELDQAFEAKKLSESEYRVGLEAAWLGKHINRVEKYFALPPGQGRTNYIAKLLEKKEKKRAKNAKPGAVVSNNTDLDADETAAEMKVEKWPPAIRKQWEQFHDAYRAQKKAAEKVSQPQSKPAS